MSLYLGSEKVENVTAQITLPVEPSDDLPLADGTASAGVSKKFSRADHVHPAQEIPVKSVNNKTGAVSLTASDVSAIPSTLTGTAGQVLTKTVDGQEWKDATSPQPSTTTPLAPTPLALGGDGSVGGGSVGTSTTYARGDHIHPSEVFICYIDKYSSTNITCDKTYDEIVAAYTAGKTCIARWNSSCLYLNYYHQTKNIIRFFGLGSKSNAVIEIDINNNITLSTIRILPLAKEITLYKEAWDGSTKQQSVTVSGVLADPTSQEIRVMPADATKTSAYVSCGVSCVAQASNSLTFACDKVPTTAIDVYVVMQSLNFQG